MQLGKSNGTCKGEIAFFFPPQASQKPKKSRCKTDWKIKKGFVFSSDKQSIELRKLHNPIFAASAECFIIRKCDSSLEKQQAKPKWSGGKNPQRDLLSF